MGLDISKVPRCMCKSYFESRGEEEVPVMVCELDPSKRENLKLLALNTKQTYKLKMSWKGIRRQAKATGVEMFVR